MVIAEKGQSKLGCTAIDDLIFKSLDVSIANCETLPPEVR